MTSPGYQYGYPYQYGYGYDQSCPTNVRLSEADLAAVQEGQSVRLVGTNQCGQPVDLTVQGVRGSQVGGPVVGSGQSVGAEEPLNGEYTPMPPAPPQSVMGDPIPEPPPPPPLGAPEFSPMPEEEPMGDYTPMPEEGADPPMGDVDPMAEFMPRQ